tara:strand:- start:431 stop:658 length:228 start_codon:yes stop_codon:yes gene_type:complete
MSLLKVTSIKYTNTRRGIAYVCTTNITGLRICNDGHGGGTFLEGEYKLTKNYEHDGHLETWLESLIDEYENNLNL